MISSKNKKNLADRQSFDVILIDGSSYLHRAYHALPPLYNSQNQPTGAIFGFINMLLKLQQKQYEAEYFVIVFDTKEKSFRAQLSPIYKSTRPPMPDDLQKQIAPLYQLLLALGYPVLSYSGVEADDVIATLATFFQEKSVLIVTSDKDLMQLVNSKVKILDTLGNVFYDENKVLEKFGVYPDKLRDYLALIGDKSDNVLGIPGVGPKGALDILKQFGSIQNINVDEIKRPKIAESFRQNKNNLDLAVRLISLKKDVDIRELQNLDLLKIQKPDLAKVISLLEELEFKTLLQEYKKQQLLTEKTDEQSSSEINNFADVSFVVIDEKLVQEKTLAEIWALFLDQNQKKVLYDLKKWLKFLARNGFKTMDMAIIKNVYDVMLESYVLNTNAVIPEKANLLACHQELYNKISASNTDLYLYHNLELPLAFILFVMEEEGVLLSREKIKVLGEEISEKLAVLEEKAILLAGVPFNLNSPKQVQFVLYEKLHLDVFLGNKNHKRSTAEDVLKVLANAHELPKILLEYRSLFKLKTSYLDKLPTYINPQTKKIHTNFNQALTSTGRLSSSEPNLQNIPAKGEYATKIRESFIISSPDHEFIMADYSQIELRLMAHFSQDENLQKAFLEKQDVHAQTAATIFEKDITEVTKEERRRAKSINFGLLYGMSSFGLAQQLMIPREEAEKYIKIYFEKYRKLKIYTKCTEEFASLHGYVETFLKRKIYINDLNSHNFLAKNAALRAAVNAPLQGTAAEIIKLAMIRIYELIEQGKIKAKMFLQIHDELIFEGSKENNEADAILIKNVMENVCPLSVPLVVNITRKETL